MGFLTDLTADVRRRLDRTPLDDGRLMARALAMPPTRPFARRLLHADDTSVIAEVKRASPSAGDIAPDVDPGDRARAYERGGAADVDPGDRARAYERGGAAAISVLTEPTRFGGALADLQTVHQAVRVPVLRKDFVVHPSQVIEARASGADAVLLITAALDPTELKALLVAATDLGLGALVETHSAADLDVALATEAQVIGVNARDLETLEVDAARALALLERVPDDRVAVFESGVRDRADVERAAAAGARAVLVGESLMRAPDPEGAVRSLRGAA